MPLAGEVIFKVGDKVILGKHQGPQPNWASDMDQYVGKEATIIKVLLPPVGGDMSGSHCYRVDTNSWMWRGENMLPAVVEAIMKSPTYGAKCKRCGEWNEYAVASPDGFVCFGCRH